MKAGTVILCFTILIIGFVIYFSFSTGNEDYFSSIKAERERKDDWFRSSPDSPFYNQKNSFHGLKYYAPDLKYKVTATLEPIKERKIATVYTNTGSVEHYLEYAYANFKLEGAQKLLILEVLEKGAKNGNLFLALTDKTSAKETYGSGRYLDIRKVRGESTIELDFNRLYNPYCAYSDNFSCPFPPKENNLTIPILAGEKQYKPN